MKERELDPAQALYRLAWQPKFRHKLGEVVSAPDSVALSANEMFVTDGQQSSHTMPELI